MLPKHNLHVTEDKKSDQSEPPPPRPTSAMSEDFKPPGREAIRKIVFTKLLIYIACYMYGFILISKSEFDTFFIQISPMCNSTT